MSNGAMKILAETMNRLIGPSGIYSSNASASAASKTVSRSTFDRLRNGDKIGASAVAVDTLDGVAAAFEVEVWQLLVPGMDPRNNLPKLITDEQIEASLPADEQKLLAAYRALGKKGRQYLLADAQKYLDIKKA